MGLINGQTDRGEEALLRVFHVQNAPWATQYLLRKFNINNRDDLTGTDFGKFIKYKRPERRGGKPFTNGKAWKTVRGGLSFSNVLYLHWSHFTRSSTCLNSIDSKDIFRILSACLQEYMLTPKTCRPMERHKSNLVWI